MFGNKTPSSSSASFFTGKGRARRQRSPLCRVFLQFRIARERKHFFTNRFPRNLLKIKKKTYRTTSSGGIFFFLCFPDSSVHFRRKPAGIFSCRSSIERSINQIQCKYFEIHSFNCHLAAGRRRHSNDLTTQTAGQCSAKKGEKVSPHHKKLGASGTPKSRQVADFGQLCDKKKKSDRKLL